MPSISFASISRLISKIRAAICVGDWIDCERVRWRKSAVFSFSVTVVPDNSLLLSRDETFSDSRHSTFSSVAKSRMSLVERGLVGNRLGAAIGDDAAVVDAARQPPQPAAFAAELFHQVDLVGAAADR